MQKHVIRVLVITAAIMVLPIVGSLTVEGWNWSGIDFVFAGVVFLCLVSLLEYGLTRGGSLFYKAGFGIGVMTGFALLWGNAVHGMVGEDNPGNLAFVLLLAISLVTAAINKFRACGLDKTMFWAAAGMILIPTALLLTGGGNFPESPAPRPMAEMFAISSVFAAGFLVSGLLFRKASSIEACATS